MRQQWCAPTAGQRVGIPVETRPGAHHGRARHHPGHRTCPMLVGPAQQVVQLSRQVADTAAGAHDSSNGASR